MKNVFLAFFPNIVSIYFLVRSNIYIRVAYSTNVYITSNFLMNTNANSIYIYTHIRIYIYIHTDIYVYIHVSVVCDLTICVTDKGYNTTYVH